MKTYSFIHEIHPINPLHVSNRFKLMKNNNVNKKSNEHAHMILVLNTVSTDEGSGKHVKMSLEDVLLVYTK